MSAWRADSLDGDRRRLPGGQGNGIVIGRRIGQAEADLGAQVRVDERVGAGVVARLSSGSAPPAAPLSFLMPTVADRRRCPGTRPAARLP